MRASHFTALTTIVLASSVLGGCGFLKSLVGKNSVDLSEAQMQKMDVGLRKQDPTVCPREKTQMVIMADVLLKGDKQAKRLETYTGGAEANKNDKMEFTDFTFASNLGAVDKYGFLTPNPDVLASTDKQFEIVTAFKREPTKFNVTSKYKPSYDCIKDAGSGGKPGDDGQDGSSGGAGQAGAYGGTDNVGGRGAAGGPGNPGASGTDGGNGPNVVAFATIVKTPFYDKLVAIKVSGDVEDFVLVPFGAPVTIRANGGAGGAGGNGGNGGSGGSGGAGAAGGDGGNGGQGGQGGQGGRGGQGGGIELTFDANHPELASQIKLDASGGAAGEAGPQGNGGSAGSGGSAGQGGTAGSSGTQGPNGAQGAGGTAGPNGHANAHPGRVADKFTGLNGITLFDAPADAPAPADDAAPAPKMKKHKKTSGQTGAKVAP
ncbi:MAG: hypothetical protein ABI183_12405 [Polyangiaceae bacterium]